MESIIDFPEQMEAIEKRLPALPFGYSLQGQSNSALNNWLHAETKLLKPVQISIDDESDRLPVKADMSRFSPEELKVEGDVLRICCKSEQRKDEKATDDATSSSSEPARP